MSLQSDIRVKVSSEVFSQIDSGLKKNYTFSDSDYSCKIVNDKDDSVIFGLDDLYSYGNEVKLDFIKNLLKKLPEGEFYKLIEIRTDNEEDILTNDYNDDFAPELYLVKSFSVK